MHYKKVSDCEKRWGKIKEFDGISYRVGWQCGTCRLGEMKEELQTKEAEKQALKCENDALKMECATLRMYIQRWTPPGFECDAHLAQTQINRNI